MRINHTNAILRALGVSAALLIGCNPAGNDDATPRAADAPVDEAEPSPAGAVAENVATPVVVDAAPSMGDDWEAWVAAEVERLQASSPELYNAVRDLEPRPTRAGFPRFTGPVVRNADAAPLLIDRLINGNETAAVRAAIVEALPRTGGAYGEALVDLMSRERDGHVRAVIVHSLRLVEGKVALEGLAMGLSDSDPAVRAASARTVGRRKDGAQLADALMTAVSDSDQQVQIEAMRTLGALKVDEAKETLVGLLGEPDADLRLHALRNLGRIDAGFAAGLPQITTLRNDPDPRVAKVAAGLQAK